MALVWQPVMQGPPPPAPPHGWASPSTLESDFKGLCIRARMEKWGKEAVMNNVAWLMVEQAGRIHGASVTDSPTVLHAMAIVYDQAMTRTDPRSWKNMAHAILHGEIFPTAWVKEIDEKVRYACEVAKWCKVLVRRAKHVMPHERIPEGDETMEAFVSNLLVGSMAKEFVEEVVVRAAMYMEAADPRLNWPARQMLFTCLLTASKMADDCHMWNSDWAKMMFPVQVFGQTATVNSWEEDLVIKGLEWNLHVHSDVYAAYKTSLGVTVTNDCVVQ